MSRDNGELKDSARIASIVIVNYNGGDAVLECLQSVLAHTESDIEIIVVDNASTDGSPDGIKAQFPKAHLIRAGANLGFGAGNNLGVKQATSDFLVFLNPDTIVCEGWLGPLLRELEADRKVGLVTAKILMADDTATINACGNSIHLTGLTLCRGLGAGQVSFSRTEDVGAVSGAAFAMRREVFEQLGGFDEDMFLYMEDTDLSLRARLAGWLCRFAPDSIVLHRYILKITPKKVFYQERNRYLMLFKAFRWRTLVVLLPVAVCAELIAWAFVVLTDRPNARNKVRAYSWIWTNWTSLLSKRKQVQSMRKIPDRFILRTMGIRLDFGQAASPVVATVGHIIFDPVFAVCKVLALAIVWW
jgi:GT2 family glycosyltransferase